MPSSIHRGQRATRDFTITRILGATPEDVFDAWTRPERVAAWFGPPGLVVPADRLRMDVRPGGSWTLTMVSDETNAEYPVEFTYVEVVKPRRLVMTTRGAETTASVTVTFQEVVDGTEMTFSVRNLDATSDSASLRAGWNASFDCLAEHLRPIR